MSEAKYRIIKRSSPFGILSHQVQKLGTGWFGRPKWKHLQWTNYPLSCGPDYIKHDISKNRVYRETSTTVYFDAEGKQL